MYMNEIATNPLEQTLTSQNIISRPVQQVVQVKYCLYARKSTESDEKQALSIDSQINEMLGIAKRDNLEVVDIRRESFSSKTAGKRPVFNQMLEDVRGCKFNGILTWAPDRLSRNAGDLGAIVDLMDQNILAQVRTFGQVFTNSPNEKFLLMILGSQAKLENDQKGVNVKRGMRTRCEMGLWPGPAPTGYCNYNQKDRLCEVFVDPDRAPAVKHMFERFANEDVAGRDLYVWLRDDVKFRTTHGKPLSLSNVYKLLNTPFYYGEFEYPKGSGNWYKGKHQPIITKELYIRVQEKTKHQQNGNVHRYVYYSCSRAKDRYCKGCYIREEKVIEQVADIIDQLDLDKVSLGHKLQHEIERYSEFQSKILNVTPQEVKRRRDIDMKNYAKYLLREGTILEKREVLNGLKSKLVLQDKKILLAT